MNKRTLFFVLACFVISCKEEVVKKPANLIDEEVMVNIMYDISLLESIKYESLNPTETNKINPSQYIYLKYKIDSTQFIQSNMYYASDYKTYKKIYEQINARLVKNKALIEAKIEKEKNKTAVLKIAKEKIKAKKVADSLVKIKKSNKGL